jgi:hypothetical protein
MNYLSEKRLGPFAVAVSVSLLLFAPAYALEYVESSNGLDYPRMESGQTELELADVNLDGHLDILSIGDHGSPYVNTDEHGVMVWFGDGAGNWSVYQNGNFGYGGIAVGDVNNDGLPDVGYAMHHNYSGEDFGDQLIEVALGDGTGRNWQPWDDGLATNGEDWGMFGTDFADVDCDGDLDVASNSFGCCAGVHVYINQGDGSWVQSFGFLGGNSEFDLVFGDINRDGNTDFAVGHQYGTVYFGDGQGGFTKADRNLPSPGTRGHEGVDLADVNGDGGMDLSFTNSSDGVEVWCWDEVNRLWIDFSGNLPSSWHAEATQLADMDLDGYIDVVAFGRGDVAVWTGDGTGNWTPVTMFSTPDPGYKYGLRVGGDADHNGYPDIALVSEEGSWPNERNHLRFFKETSIPDTVTVNPVFPLGGEVFLGGSVGFIDWTSAVPSGENSSVRLELSIAGPDGPWHLIDEDLPNNGRHQVIWPTEVSSSNCRIRYTVVGINGSAQEITPASFEIRSSSVEVVDLTVTPYDPPVTIPPQGGRFFFRARLKNLTGQSQSWEVWSMARLPSGEYYGPLERASIELGPNRGVRLDSLRQNVPGYAPSGGYLYIGYVGVYPDSVADSSYFEVTKIEGEKAAVTFDWDLYAWTVKTPEVPRSTSLTRVYPNPFNAETTVEFQLASESRVRLELFDILGRKVVTLVDEKKGAGKHFLIWDASGQASGIYFCRLTAGNYSETMRMTFLK